MSYINITEIGNWLLRNFFVHSLPLRCKLGALCNRFGINWYIQHPLQADALREYLVLSHTKETVRM